MKHFYEVTFDVTLVLRASSMAEAQRRGEEILSNLRTTPDAFIGFEIVEDDWDVE